jgi:hypothetical protein
MKPGLRLNQGQGSGLSSTLALYEIQLADVPFPIFAFALFLDFCVTLLALL